MERTREELYALHNILRKKLIDTFGLKFEICLAKARKIIRTDYHTLDLSQYADDVFVDIDKDMITLKIDTSTPQKVYKEMLANIYKVSKLKSTIKDTERFTKEQRLLFLIDIYFYKHYLKLSQNKIKEKLEDSEEIVSVFNPIDTKDIHTYISMADAIRETSNYISPEQYLYY